MNTCILVLAALTAADGFVVKMSVDVGSVTSNEQLVAMGPVKLALRMAGEDDKLRRYDCASGNYLNFPMKDGRCPIIEATISERAGRVGIPLSLVKERTAKVALRYAPPRWEINVDGNVDEDFPLEKKVGGESRWTKELSSSFSRRARRARPTDTTDVAETRDETAIVDLLSPPTFFSPRVRDVDVTLGAPKGEVPVPPAARDIVKPIQYWTPEGHNRSVGDVAPAFLNGRMHVFYLIDRRHHGSGAGTGRHQFAHLSSADLVHWQEHPLAVPIMEDWQTCGTGTPFLKDGKIALAFGWHTSRFGDAGRGKPLGGTFAISEDGIHFVNSGKIISDAQNPSIYNLADGGYELVTSYGGSIGIFHSRNLTDWKLYDAKLPFRGDCPSLFSWHGHRYLLQGFVNMAYSADGKPGSFVNWSDRADKLYEGLSVPMVANWKDNRRIYIGWLNHVYGWGGWLVFREVTFHEDGTLGLKWVPEIATPVKPTTYRFKPNSDITLRFAAKDPKRPAVLLKIDSTARTAAWVDDARDAKFEPARAANNVKIGGVRGLDRDSTVRVIAYYDAKNGATIFDAEINGDRTLICRRGGKFDNARVLSVLPKDTISTVCGEKGYNSWPMIGAIAKTKTLVCTYGKGTAHTIGDGPRGVWAKRSTDGGRTWSEEVLLANDPKVGEVMVGKGNDETGAALFWVRRCGGGKTTHDLYRTEDGIAFTKIASPELSPWPMQVTDIFSIPGEGLCSLWFATNYRDDRSSSWGMLVSRDNGKTWEQRTIESGLNRDGLPTEQSAVALGGGRILVIARCEDGKAQFQITSTDNGKSWKKTRTNISDVGASTPSLIYDAATGMIANYYYQRGPGLLRMRVAKPDEVFDHPTQWPPSTVITTGGTQRSYDSGNANAVALDGVHYVSWYSGNERDTEVLTARIK